MEYMKMSGDPMSIPGVSSKRATFLSKLAARCRLSAESEV